MGKRKVIFVTDGDKIAQRAIEIATTNIGGRCISASAGNPTELSGADIAALIKQAVHDPVVVMVDDRGVEGIGNGEEVMLEISADKEIDIVGVVAVSSNGKDCNGLKVSCSITKDGKIIEGAVDKDGNVERKNELCGDTLSVLKDMKGLTIVGIGDPGKMDYNDEASIGAPITTKALQEVLLRASQSPERSLDKN
jgi:stage V sporulation protein AE